MKLHQKRGREFKHFELKKDKLFIKEKLSFSTKEYSINIEEIGFNKVIEIHSRKGIKILGSFFILLSFVFLYGSIFEESKNPELGGLIWGFFGGLALGIACFKAPMNDSILLNGGDQTISFFLNFDSRNETEKFVDKLIEKSKESLIKKYTRIDTDLPSEVYMNQLNWLLNHHIINIDTYEEKKNEYKTACLINYS